MRLDELASLIPGARLIGGGDAEVSAAVYDSRAAVPGSIFVAVPGFKVDGHDYLAQAIAAGAAAVAVQADREAQWRSLADGGTPLLVLPDSRAGLARIAAALNGFPARRLKVIGITGTDGKTSLAHLVAHVLGQPRAGLKPAPTGLISTAECRIGGEMLPDSGRFTTPEAPEVQSMLAAMVEAGCEWAVIEATSHGLALHRVDECEYDIAAFTNLGLDHIDFHGTAEEYRAAKGRLFELLDASVDKGVPKTAVLNADDPACEYFRSRTKARALTYGMSDGCDVRASQVTPADWGIDFALMGLAEETRVRLPRPGEFNVYNALAAAAIGSVAGMAREEIVAGLESWPGAPGRMELIDEGQHFRVVVDFAHSPDSLRRVLEMLRAMTRGRLFVVFGCIGERDRERRPGMARAAAELADYTIVTDDNPYSEDRMSVIDDIARGMREEGKREGHDFAVVPDRREAISQALAMAVDEDCVLLAGKGHEREVHLGQDSYPCDDREVARRILNSEW